eukprot:scaffold99194_cov51-Phaeocystis_antarctica.AAC.1
MATDRSGLQPIAHLTPGRQGPRHWLATACAAWARACGSALRAGRLGSLEASAAMRCAHDGGGE